MSAVQTPNDVGQAMYGGYLRRMPDPSQAEAQSVAGGQKDGEEVLPLPGWLIKLYFLFPIILYLPDAIFNYFVYSDGAGVPGGSNPVVQVAQVALWASLSVGVVGMAYLLSVIAPWHFQQRRIVQGFFCALGVLFATAVTTWNSLAFRSTGFTSFKTDEWVYATWPDLKTLGISVTMILVAVAPPFWGLFWAIVQPTQIRKNLAHMQGSHEERMMRLQQEAEIKTLRAEANAKIRAAQLKGMAQTAAAAREQAGVVAAQWRNGGKGKQDEKDGDQAPAQTSAPAAVASQPATAGDMVQEAPDSGIRLQRLPDDYTLPGSMTARPPAAPGRRRKSAEPALTLSAPARTPSRHVRSDSVREDTTADADEDQGGSRPLDHAPAIRRGAARV